MEAPTGPLRQPATSRRAGRKPVQALARDLGRRFGFPILLFAVGLTVDVVAYVGALHATEDRATEALADDGSDVISLIEEAVQHGLRQTSAVDGLFQASEVVTVEEFEEFAHIVGGWPVAQLGFARIVPATELDAYLTDIRITQPDFEVYERSGSRRQPLSFRPRYAPVQYAVSFFEEVGDRGFDLASDPKRLKAIDSTLRTAQPTLTGFVDIVGDEAPGDVELLRAIEGPSGEAIGFAFALLQLDEILAERAPEILPLGITWSFAEPTPDNAVAVRHSDQWRETVPVLDTTFVFELHAPPELLKQERRSGFAAFAVGLLAAVLAALALHFFLQHLRSRGEVARLRELTRQKDRFLAGVSHELRTPLTAVIGLLEVLTDGSQVLADGDTAEYLELARQEAKELADLVEDLLTAGRLSAGTLMVSIEPVDLNYEIHRVVERLIVPSGRQLHVGQQLGSVWADPLRFRQILRNLVTNALRYGESSIEIEAANSGESVSLEVRNDGPPIPTPMRGRIFEPFQTGGSQPTQPDSIGLGLSISRQLARTMGGDLTYRYHSGRSIFTVTLPMAVLTATDGDPTAFVRSIS